VDAELLDQYEFLPGLLENISQAQRQAMVDCVFRPAHRVLREVDMLRLCSVHEAVEALPALPRI
jgi:hypothetical protein